MIARAFTWASMLRRHSISDLQNLQPVGIVWYSSRILSLWKTSSGNDQ
jgi:hypothetical protein